MIENINYNKIYFVSSIPNIHHLPSDNIIEIAFIGRSNSGKSSIINTLTNQKKLAKTSKKQGCTKLINIFEIPFKIRLMDFQGYGYSNASKKNQKEWYYTLNQYIKKRKNPKRIILITDIRHPINQLDQNIIKKIKKTKIPLLILLNKSDKIIKHTSCTPVQKIKKIITTQNTQIITFSTKTMEGIHNLKKIINIWNNNIKNNNI